MAEAAGHKFGQSIGDYREASIGPLLSGFGRNDARWAESGTSSSFLPTILNLVFSERSYDESGAAGPLVKYEVQIRYSNEDKIDAEFQTKGTTIDFLKAYLSGNWTPDDEELDELTKADGTGEDVE